MTYQIQPPLTIAIKGQDNAPSADFSVNGHGFRPKRTAIPLANVPWQNNGQLVTTSTQTFTSAGQPGSAQKPSGKKEDKRSTELIYAEELVKDGQLAVRDDVIHRWNGSHYEAMNSKATVRHALKWLASKFPRQANKSMAHACVEAASLLLPQMPERDPQRTIIPLRNAYIEVKANASFERHLPHPSFGMTSALKITLPGGGKSYMPGALPPTSRLAKFLTSSVPDTDVCNFLQELMGDTLTPSNRHQVATLLKGSGRNGKSVLVRLMTALHEKVAHMRLDKLSGFQLMPLLDASLVVAEEVPAAGFDEQTLKSLISGESVTVDRKYLSPVSYRPSAKWIISTNNDQRSRDNTMGFWRRLCIIPFTQQIDPNDVITDLDQDIIKHEMHFLLDWCLEGLQRLMVRGKLPQDPDAVRQAKVKAVVASNSVAAWIEHESVAVACNGEGDCNKKAVYARYCEWSSVSKIRPLSLVQFWPAIRALLDFPEDTQRRIGDVRERFVQLKFMNDFADDIGGHPFTD